MTQTFTVQQMPSSRFWYELPSCENGRKICEHSWLVKVTITCKEIKKTLKDYYQSCWQNKNCRRIGNKIQIKCAQKIQVYPCIMERMDTHGRFFCYFFKGRQLVWIPVCFPLNQAPLEKEVYSKRKEFAPQERVLSFLSRCQSARETKTFLTELLPMQS